MKKGLFMKLSVCMTTYNGEKFIKRQLNSVVNQIKEHDEIIVVDDCSSDQTVTLIEETFGDRIKVFKNSENLGVIKSFEKAISKANGDIIFLCDQDDIWEDNKVERVLEAFKEQKAALVAHDALVVDNSENIIHPSWNTYNGNTQKGIVGNIIKNSFTGCCMAFNSDIKNEVIPFPKGIEMHDQWIAIVAMLKRQKIVYIDAPLMKYVRHGGNVTGTKKRTFTEMFKGRMGTISALIRAL